MSTECTHDKTATKETARPDKTVLLLGNSNVGKTEILHRLCLKNVKIANQPGTSTPVGRGIYSTGGKDFEIIDTPGVSALATFTSASNGGGVSRDILLDEKPEIIAHIVDGRNLRQGLATLLQLTEFETPLVMNINMTDESEKFGISIDREKLAELIGVEVTETAAVDGKGISEFGSALSGKASVPTVRVEYPPAVESALAVISKLTKGSRLPPRALGTALLAGDVDMLRRVLDECGAELAEQIVPVVKVAQSRFRRSLDTVILEARLKVARRILLEVQTVKRLKIEPFSIKLGRWSRQLPTGIPIAMFVVVVLYIFVGKFGAEFLVEFFEGKVFGEWFLPVVDVAVSVIPSSFVHDMLLGRFGIISVGLTLALAIVLPVLATFFFAFGILEESGYLPRLSILLDRLFRKIGLNGKSVLPLSMGFSCTAMAILTTRMLETRRERFIATLLLAFGFPCAPLLGVMLVILAGLSFWATIVVFGVIFTQTMLVGYIAGKILPGHRSDFIQELPPMRFPRLIGVLKRTVSRVWMFAKEAIPYFLAATFALFLLDKIGMLLFIEKAGEPVLTGFVGLPSESTGVMIMAVLRRESGAALLKQMTDGGIFDSVQVVVALIVMTFLVPCVNAVIVIIKERGVGAALSIITFVIAYALLVGAAVNLVCRSFGVSF